MRIKIFLALVVIFISLSGYIIFVDGHSSDEPKVTNLFLSELAREFTPDREIRVDLVELPPGSKLERHYHPGEEFHYYLEGDVEIKLDDSSFSGKPGTVGHVPFKKYHEAIGGAEGAKVLVFRVHTKGKPWRYVDEKDKE